MEYQVELATYRGPLDLLLFLVKRNEVDLCDIPIAKLTEQFLDYLNLLQVIDVETAGEFLVMAATLMEIKSRLLLPRAEEELTDEVDPRQELVKQLIEYKKYKEAADLLEEQAEKQMARLPRTPADVPGPVDPSSQPLRKVELWDLVSAFGRLLRETASLQPSSITIDETPIAVHMENILTLLRERLRVTLGDLFTPPRTKGRLLGLFLATLELIKARAIVAEQSEEFGEVTIVLAAPSDEPIALSEGVTSATE